MSTEEVTTPAMRPLFVSYTGHRDGTLAFGQRVIAYGPIATAEDITGLLDALGRHLAQSHGYDPNSLVIISFRRLEDQEAA